MSEQGTLGFKARVVYANLKPGVSRQQSLSIVKECPYCKKRHTQMIPCKCKHGFYGYSCHICKGGKA